MKNKPTVSIIIATYNSARLLPKVLQSIRRQRYPKSEIEVLVIDGGSTDETIRIARLWGCRVIHNPKTLPAWAKYIGFLRAKGKYLMYLDSDEIIESSQSMARKIRMFTLDPKIRAVTGSGYRSPQKSHIVNHYINEFGDPFSFFIYRLSKDYRFFIRSMKAKYQVKKENKDGVVFEFSPGSDLPIFELVAMGSMVDRVYLKKNFPQILHQPSLIPHLFYLIVTKGGSVAILTHDVLTHYSSDNVKKYLGKITSRVVSNIFTPAGDGFAGRSEFAHTFSRYKKYLFLPYSYSLILPLVDAMYLSVTRGRVGYLLHAPLSLYTATLILYYMLVKQLGYKPTFKSYGQQKSITV